MDKGKDRHRHVFINMPLSIHNFDIETHDNRYDKFGMTFQIVMSSFNKLLKRLNIQRRLSKGIVLYNFHFQKCPCANYINKKPAALMR